MNERHTPQEPVRCRCLACDKDFTVLANKFRAGRGKYCSRLCSSLGYWGGTFEQRWAASFEQRGADECWPWLAVIVNRYGYIWKDGKPCRAHRLAYEMAKGPLGNLFACHTCDNSICVNPAHIFAGTHTDNMRDCSAKGRLRSQKVAA